MKTIEISENTKPRGYVRLRGYRGGTIAEVEPYVKQKRIYQQLILGKGDGVLPNYFRSRISELDFLISQIFERNFLGLESAIENRIMQGSLTGKDLLVQYLCASGLVGATVYAGINYGALGTGVLAPTDADTQLTTETVRVAIANAIDVGFNTAELQFFFTDALLANGTYYEVGSFMNGTGTANSGKIFNHALLGTPYAKTAGIDTTLEIDISLT